MTDCTDYMETKENIQKLYLKLLNKTKIKWNRDLPFDELLFELLAFLRFEDFFVQ